MKTIIQFTKSFVIIFLALAFIPSIHVLSQASYSPYVEYIVSQASMNSISLFARELTGDTMTTIGGQPYLIYSRYAYSPANEKASQYILEKFQSYGLTARYQAYSTTGRNVIATKPGIRYPNKQYLICGHYDNYTFAMEDTIHGADDNASGTAAVLEAARVLSQFTFDYTIIFVALDEEEVGLFGSGSYADTAFASGDSLLGAINLDMIAFDSNNDNIMQVGSDTNSSKFADVLVSCCLIYQPQLVPLKSFSLYGSDQISFWERGFTAGVFHEYTADFNRYTHTILDNYAQFNRPYFLSIVKSAIAALAILGNDLNIYIGHEPLTSTYDTSGRIAQAVISSKLPIAALSNQPRLYFKTYATEFEYVNAFYANQDTFMFMIPGFPAGTTVDYYIAAQDSAATMVNSSPSGCRGMNPPGTLPPVQHHSYHILDNFSVCSIDLPKDIPPRSIIYDSIFVDMTKLILDIDVQVTINHSNDTDLYVMLNRSGFAQTNMSVHNGGNCDNYINTVFDDEADTLITNGTPPFTGHYRPEISLDKFDNSPTSGYWVLKILNMSDSITGQLVDWCVNITYYNPIGVEGNLLPVEFCLSQNFPNPFNASTKISYEIPKQGNVMLVVYDILGRVITVLVNKELKAGKYEAFWNASNYASGIYFYMIRYNDIIQSKKMVLIK